ncbi:MAG: hypothetical protein JNM07_01990 [Phycisphaerae bacterium]|nr:hypothetical protein [Phycisphaerae bacterium]
MAGIVKTAIRVGVVGLLASGGLVLIAGPERVHAAFSQLRGAVNRTIDSNITDPVALRAQLRSLESAYPERIKQVKGDLAELRAQVGSLEYELAWSERVSEQSGAEGETLRTLLSQAEQARVQVASMGDPTRLELVYGNERLSVDQACSRANFVSSTHSFYVSKCEDIRRDLGYLSQQEGRLVALLEKLESEQNDFRAQLMQLDRQVDSIARNERMIDMLASRQKTIDEQSRYRAASLDQLSSRLSELRARQEAELSTLASAEARTTFEQKARIEVDRERATKAMLERQVRAKSQLDSRKSVVEIRVPAAGTAEVRPALPPAGKNEEREKSVAASGGR